MAMYWSWGRMGVDRPGMGYRYRMGHWYRVGDGNGYMFDHRVGLRDGNMYGLCHRVWDWMRDSYGHWSVNRDGHVLLNCDGIRAVHEHGVGFGDVYRVGLRDRDGHWLLHRNRVGRWHRYRDVLGHSRMGVGCSIGMSWGRRRSWMGRIYRRWSWVNRIHRCWSWKGGVGERRSREPVPKVTQPSLVLLLIGYLLLGQGETDCQAYQKNLWP